MPADDFRPEETKIFSEFVSFPSFGEELPGHIENGAAQEGQVMSGTGDRVQLSVHECQLTETERPQYRTMGVPWVPKDRDVIVI